MSQELIQTIFSRRSIRSFTAQLVKGEQVTTLLKAAMAAPSASNLKPWHFVVATERETLDSLAEAHPFGKMLFQAPLAIAVCGDAAISVQYWVQDCSAATENLLLAATALGLGSVWLGVYPKEERIKVVRDILGIPESVIPLNLIPIGYPDESKEPRTQYDATRAHTECW